MLRLQRVFIPWNVYIQTKRVDTVNVSLISTLFVGRTWNLLVVVVVQLFSRVQLFAAAWTATRQASLSITKSQSLLKLMSIESVMPSNHLILCHPPSLPAFNLSQHQGLYNESALHMR